MQLLFFIHGYVIIYLFMRLSFFTYGYVILLYIWLLNYKPADYITIYKTSTVPANAMLMINREANTRNLTGEIKTDRYTFCTR